MYIYIYICTYTYISVHTYIYIERERGMGTFQANMHFRTARFKQILKLLRLHAVRRVAALGAALRVRV